jgi:hypothetical protein
MKVKINMISISRYLALMVFAAGAATVAFATPSQAQVEGAQPRQLDAAGRPVCCTPATKTIATGSAGWTLRLPNNALQNPVPIAQKHPLWSNPIPGSQWVGPTANSGLASLPVGWYTYSYRFCLCSLLPGEKTEPGSLTLHVYADDAFIAELNGVNIGQKLTGWSFTSSSPPAPKGSAAAPGGTLITAKVPFRCDNVLTIKVQNGVVSPTGLDVLGTITGYFGNPAIPAPGRACECGGPASASANGE